MTWFRLERASFYLGVIKSVIHIIQHKNVWKLYDFNMFASQIVFLSLKQKITEVNARWQWRAHLMRKICTVHGG